MTKPAERFLIFFIRAYQHTVGMLIPRVCRYEPTCSQYAIEAIREHGVFRGLVLSAWRIMRCNPWCQGGYDPVPVNKTKKVYRHIRISASGYQGIRVSGNDTNEQNALNDPNDLNVFYHRNLNSYHCNLSAEGRS